MQSEILTTDHLDYLQRVGISPAALSADLPLTSAPPHLRRLIRVEGIGRSEKSTSH